MLKNRKSSKLDPIPHKLDPAMESNLLINCKISEPWILFEFKKKRA